MARGVKGFQVCSYFGFGFSVYFLAECTCISQGAVYSNFTFFFLYTLNGKKFGAAAAPRGNAVALNRRPQRTLCIGRQLSYFGNAAFPVCGNCGSKVLWQPLSMNVVREQAVSYHSVLCFGTAAFPHTREQCGTTFWGYRCLKSGTAAALKLWWGSATTTNAAAAPNFFPCRVRG